MHGSEDINMNVTVSEMSTDVGTKSSHAMAQGWKRGGPWEHRKEEIE